VAWLTAPLSIRYVTLPEQHRKQTMANLRYGRRPPRARKIKAKGTPTRGVSTP